jgi:hypothetical protein
MVDLLLLLLVFKISTGGFIFFRSVEEELDETLTENTEVT